MILTDQKNFSMMMINVAEIYSKKLSKTLLDIYWRCLESYSLSQIRAALRTHLLHPDCGQFMPKPADILRAIHGDTESQAIRAWSKVLQAIKRVGSYESVVFDDPIIHSVIVDLGGWISLCRTDTKSLVFKGKQFEKIYRCYLQTNPKFYLNRLLGQLEHLNPQYATVNLLGEKNKALQVLEKGCDPADHSRNYVSKRLDKRAIAQIQPKENIDLEGKEEG